MTPSEQIAYLRSYAARKPNARLGPAIERLAVMTKVDALKPVTRPRWAVVSALVSAADEVRAMLNAALSEER